MQSYVSIHDIPGEIVIEFMKKMDKNTWVAFIKTCKVYYNLLSKNAKTQTHKDHQIIAMQKYAVMIDKMLYYGAEYNAFKYLKITPDKKAVTELTYTTVYCYDCSTPISITNIKQHKTKCNKGKPLLCKICSSPTPYHQLYISECIYSTFHCEDCGMELYKYETISHISVCQNFAYKPSVYKKPIDYKKKPSK